MKNLFVPLALLFFSSSLVAQVKWGPRIGISTSDLSAKDITITRPGGFQDLALGIKEAKYGVQVGAFAQFRLLKLFYLQPEVLFNSNRIDFSVNNFSELDGLGEVVREKYQYLDIPLIAGIKLGPIRGGIGPVAKVFLNSTSGLADFQGIEEDFRQMELGYQAQVGLDLGRIILDLKFDRSLNEFGDFLIVNGEPFDFGEYENRMVFSLGYSF